MFCSKLSMIAVVALTVAITNCLAQSLSHDERCQVIEGNGIRVDQCDGSKHLVCKDGRCQCPDPANQVWTYRNEIINTRNKRSPGKKGGGFKKIAGGAAVGAVAGVATYQVAKSASKAFTTTPPPPKYQRVYSCYSRVDGQCALNTNNWETVDSGSTTTVTTAAPASPTSEGTVSSDNSTVTNGTTTTTAPPQAAAQVSKLDLSKVPQCVQYASCKHGKPAAGNNGTSSGFVQKVDFDPRLGVCSCNAGYQKTSKDICVRDKSGAGKTVTGASFAVILATLVINKMFV